ncbi:MAG: hypothetical protein AAF604_10275 [Acidobacteriota bacterium]
METDRNRPTRPPGQALLILVLVLALGSWASVATARPLTDSCSVFCAAEVDACLDDVDTDYALAVPGCHTSYQGCLDQGIFTPQRCQQDRDQCLEDAMTEKEGGELFCDSVLLMCEEDECPGGGGPGGGGGGGGAGEDDIEDC